jgi:hypothetical protein
MMGTTAHRADDITAGPANCSNGCDADVSVWDGHSKLAGGEANRTLDGDTGDTARMGGCSPGNVNRPVLPATHDDGLIWNAFRTTTSSCACRHRNPSISPHNYAFSSFFSSLK